MKYGMVIDLRRCIGCDGCNIGCKNENNVPTGFFWAHHILEQEGEFPNYHYRYIPTLCNHCSNAPCIAACPVEPKAIFKLPNGITMNSQERCIGCRACEHACPYDVISYNPQGEDVHPDWQRDEARELVEKVGGNTVPWYNPDPGNTWAAIREPHKVEKCSFCHHRVEVGEQPWCVEVCPATARFFGDLDDPNSEVSTLLAENEHFVLQPEAGTEPQVYYINDFDQKS